MPEETTHKRRVRYKGTHPRTFEEKYKEHDPEKYADTVAKVIEKGSTPAGMHIPIMVKEILTSYRSVLDKRDWMQHLATVGTPGRCWKS